MKLLITFLISIFLVTCVFLNAGFCMQKESENKYVAFTVKDVNAEIQIVLSNNKIITLAGLTFNERNSLNIIKTFLKNKEVVFVQDKYSSEGTGYLYLLSYDKEGFLPKKFTK